MLVSAAKTALKAYGFDDNDPLLTWLEASKQLVEAADDWPFLRKQVTIAITANLAGLSGASAPVLPVDFFKAYSVRDATDQRKLDYVDALAFDRDIDNPATAGLPSIYTLISLGSGAAPQVQLRWWPVSAVPWSLLLTYQATLVDISGLGDGVSMPGPSEFHYIMVQGAAAIALQADNEEDRAETAQTQFNEGLGRLRRKYFSNIDEPVTVQDVMGYGAV